MEKLKLERRKTLDELAKMMPVIEKKRTAWVCRTVQDMRLMVTGIMQAESYSIKTLKEAIVLII